MDSRRGGDARARRRVRGARGARPGGARPERGDRGRNHRLDGEDVDEGHPRRHLRPPAKDDRGRGELQQRARRAADALPAGARHRGLHPRARHAWSGADRGARGNRPPVDRSDHERRAGTSGARRLARSGGRGEGRAHRGAAAGRCCHRARRLRGGEARHRGRAAGPARRGCGERGYAAALRRPRRHLLLSRPPPRGERAQRSARGGVRSGIDVAGPGRGHVLALARRGDRRCPEAACS